MQVTNVRVSFLREKQPAQYEKAAPAVEFSAVLADGEDHGAAARALMISASTVVYNALGYNVPAKVAEKLASGTVPAELSVATETTETSPAAPETAEETPETEADKPKTRGRPRGSKDTGPRKETAAAKKKRLAAEAEAAKAAENDSVPGDDETPNISTGEERVDPNDSDGIPGDDDASDQREEHVPDDTEFTPKDLHTLIMSHVNATPRTLSVANAKQVLANFKVARAQDLTNEQALEGKAMVGKMVAATAAS
jgi:hypothetical protein